MLKKSNKVSDIFVKKIAEKWKIVCEKSQLLSYWISSGGAESRFSYALSLLIQKKLAIRGARDIYLLNETENLEEFYWQIIDKIVKIYSPSGVILGSEKSLELIMKNFLSPEKLVLYTRDISLRIQLFDGKEVHFRTLVSGEKSSKKNVFSLFKKYTTPLQNYKTILLPIPELALLEALSLREYEVGINESLILLFLSRNHKNLNKEILGFFVQYRYIRAINRLRAIAKTQNFEKLYLDTLEIIKEQGGGIFLSL